MSTTKSRPEAGLSEAAKQAQLVFHSFNYLRLNHRRHEHLASLGLDLNGRRVLEVGAGVGDHTSFFLDRGCSVVSLEPRAENCELYVAIMQERKRLGYERVGQCRLVRGDVAYMDATMTDVFDIVYCYGLLYHVSDPAAVLAAMARRCGDLFLLETCVSFGDDESEHLLPEPPGNPSHAFHGVGCRPTRPWVFNRLKGLYPHVYVPSTQPAHEEFPLDWRGPSRQQPWRAIFIASRRALTNPLLLDDLPQRQTIC